MSLEDGARMIAKAYEKRSEEQHFTYYVANSRHFEKQMSFEEYLNIVKQQPRKVRHQSAESILNDVKDILTDWRDNDGNI